MYAPSQPLIRLSAHSTQASQYANQCILSRTLESVPKLRGLHVIGCPNIFHVEVLSLLERSPHLESLAFTMNVCAHALFLSKTTHKFDRAAVDVYLK